MSIKILSADSVHFHDRNFKSLFSFIKKNKIIFTKNEEINSWVGLFGNYESKSNELKIYKKQISKLKTGDDFLKFKYKNKKVWDIARSELYCWFLPNMKFNPFIKGKDDESHIELMLKVNKNVVVNCFAASVFFLEYWSIKVKKTPIQNYILIFSGSQIYNRSLLEILKHSQTYPIVLEHFFTGNEYYFEERYSPIPNSSDLKYLSLKRMPLDKNEFDRVRVKAINKVLLSNNKNVKKSGEIIKLSFSEGKTIALVGQVVNDYSIIETGTDYLNSIEFYKEFIFKLTAQGYNVVFKAHPWERHKSNLKTSLTLDTLIKWSENNLDKSQREKVVFTETIDIDSLFSQVDYISGLCSQGLLEAAFEGYKPIQFGNAFYGNKGFTHDYQLIDEFINDLECEGISGYLSLDEYDDLENFLILSLEQELISVHQSGVSKLEKKLEKMPLIPLLEKKVKPLNFPKDENKIKVEIKEKTKINKKIEKLKKDPKGFFRDSKLNRYRIKLGI